MRLFVGNLSFTTTDKDILTHFQGHGFKPITVKLVIDRDTNRSRGFSFVDLSTDLEGNNALQKLNGSDLAGRKLKITVAEDKRVVANKPYVPNTPPKPTVAQRPFPSYKEEPTNTYIEPTYQFQEYPAEVSKEQSRRKDQNRKKSRERNEEEDW